MGTFSKVLLPSLRLGYLVLPPDLIDAFVAARAVADRHSPLVEQAALAEFIAEGHLDRHVRRMRMLYTERQQALLEATARETGGLLDLRPANAGMHLVGYLPEHYDDAAVARAAADAGVEVVPISAYRLQRNAGRGGLVLGYACATPEDIRIAAAKLGKTLAAVQPRRRRLR
jgi:GntR family transcriptional regulator/MocR family aminotransferase